ncbi:hypothetical protein JYT72_02995, partial [Crocinitomix catalasitica]|nr:hypothetical protein [Crocinitomix catalasitica]
MTTPTLNKLLLLVLCLSFGTVGYNYTVTDAGDAGPGTLREGVESATGGETIIFDASLAGSTIVLVTPITVPASVTVDGEDNNITISGGGTTGIFTIP